MVPKLGLQQLTAPYYSILKSFPVEKSLNMTSQISRGVFIQYVWLEDACLLAEFQMNDILRRKIFFFLTLHLWVSKLLGLISIQTA